MNIFSHCVFYKTSFSEKNKILNEKSGVALSQLSLILHYSRRIFNSITFIFNLYFMCFVADELPAFIIMVYNFLT